MKKAIKQRFFLSLCLLMLFSLFGGGNLAWAQGKTVVYTLDFTTKSDKNQYYDKDWIYSSKGIDWTINGAANNNATWAYVRTGGKTQKWSYYKSKSAIEEKISSLVLTALNTKSNNAFTMKSVKLTVARDADFTDIIDEVTLTDISTSMTFVPNEGKSWTNAYYMLYFTWSNTKTGSNYGMDVQKVDFYSAASTEPSITTSSSKLSFDEVETTSSKELSFTLSGQNLTADATLSITGTNAGYFSVDPASISQEGGTIAETKVTVTYTPTAVEPHTATLTIASSGATTQEIALSGTGIDPLPIYTVSWMVDGKSYTTGNPSTSVKKGKRVTDLPTEPAAIGSKVFVGWTNAPIAEAQPTAPAVLFTTPEKAPAVTDDVTYYYAVFATVSVTSDAKSLSEITDGGVYHIVATKSGTNYYLKADQTAGAGERGSTTKVAEAGEFILEGSGGTWAIKVKGTEYYMALNGTNASVTYQNAAAKYTVTDKTNAMKFVIRDRQLCLNGSSVTRFGSYAASYNGAVYIWLKGIGSYTDYCTTLPVQLAVGATGYATLYYSNYDLVVPENTEAYTFRSENGALMESVRYDEGEVIPAGEAVVVYTINDVPCTLNFKKGIATAACDARSQLAGTDKETEITSDENENYYFYGLSLNSSNDINSVGFYWMVDGGAAFTNGAHKAYLKIKKSEFAGAQPVRGFAFKGTATGVESVESSNNAPQAIYDLTGRRVSKAEKGIYIINGKKVIK